MNMGERIKQLRIANGLTQEKLGKYLGVQKSAIRKYENGSVTNIKRTSIEIMSKLFNVSPSYLMCIEDTDKNINDLYNKKIFAKNLNYYMKLNNISRQQISKDLKVPYTTVTSWCKGEFYPRIDKIQQLADYFSINKSNLIEYEDSNISNDNVIQIPLLGKIVAGYPSEMFSDIIDYINVPIDMIKGNKELFALNTNGNSMQPMFFDGDILIFEKSNDCESGQYCAVTVNGNEATFKKVIKMEKGIMLQPLNMEYESKFFTNDEIENLPVRIIGVLKESRRKY